MKLKLIISTAILGGAVVTPMALTLSSATSLYVDNEYKVTFAFQPIASFNKFKVAYTQEAAQAMNLWSSSLARSRPSGDKNGGLETSLSIPKLPIGVASLPAGADVLTEQGATQAAVDDQFASTPYSMDALTTDLATKVIFLGENLNSSKSVAYKLRTDSRFWNGDLVTADDIVNTIHIVLNAKNAVPWARYLIKSIGIANADKVWDEQIINGASFEEAIKKYPLGVIAVEEYDDPDVLATSAEGKAFFKREYEKGNKRHKKIVYTFNSNSQAKAWISSEGVGVTGTPTSIRHFNKVGIEKWGTSVENLMGCGPYKLKYFDLDYKAVADKWDGYWDREKVISPQIELRVLTDVSSQVQLFKNGGLGKVVFGTSMLPQFLGDTSVKKFVRSTNWSETLKYVAFNTKVERPNAKWLLDPDFRNAIQYSMDRTGFLHAQAADNSHPAEAFSTLTHMEDNRGQTVINNSIGFDNDLGFIDSKIATPGVNYHNWNSIYQPVVNKEVKMFNRSQEILKSSDIEKNDLKDYLYDKELAKAYWARFLKNNPDFNGVNLDFMVFADMQDQLVVLTQNIKDILPGVNITIKPKLTNIFNQEMAKMDWDLCINDWLAGFRDPWAYYHLLADKIHTNDLDKDEVSRAGTNKSAVSDGFNLIDFIAQKLSKPGGESYFTDELHVPLSIVAQFLRMEATIGSESPLNSSWTPLSSAHQEEYDDSIWDQKPTKENGFKGYKGEFDKFEPFFPGASKWGQVLKSFIENNEADITIDGYPSKEKEWWKDKNYRFTLIYPFAEKLIRSSAIGTPISRLQNSYIASRLVGELNYAGMITNYAFVYKADKIPPSPFVLPGIEAIVK